MVRTCSALKRQGIAELWQVAVDFKAAMSAAGGMLRRRQVQAERAMWDEVEDRLRARLKVEPAAADIVAKVSAGETNAIAGAEELLQLLSATKDNS